MRLCVLAAVLLAPLAALGAEPQAPLKPLPLPSIDGKPLAITAGQKTFRLPLRFAKVEAFYREQYKTDPKITLKTAGEEGQRTLTLSSKRGDDTWAKAVVKEGEVETAVEVTPVTRFAGTTVEGKPPMPLVIIIPRSDEATKAAESIEHAEHR